jgi:hypothetical protein
MDCIGFYGNKDDDDDDDDDTKDVPISSSLSVSGKFAQQNVAMHCAHTTVVG